MSEQSMSFKQITEHIFSVFNTYVFLNLDEISFEDKPLKAQERLINALNENPIKINNKFRMSVTSCHIFDKFCLTLKDIKDFYNLQYLLKEFLSGFYIYLVIR